VSDIRIRVCARHRRVDGDGDDAGETDVAAVESLIGARAAAKRQQDFARADRIAEELRDMHSVVADDARRHWRVVQFDGGYYRVGPKVGKARSKIGALLAERAGRINRHGEDDQKAAQILAKLATMGVLIDERRKTWRRPKRPPQEVADAAAAAAAAVQAQAKPADAAAPAAAPASAKPAAKAAPRAKKAAAGRKDWRGARTRKHKAAQKAIDTATTAAAAAPEGAPSAAAEPAEADAA